MSGDAQPNSKQRANTVHHTKPPYEGYGLMPQGYSPPGHYPSSPESPKNENIVICVVCGDRACSHLYYGVAACHGCKCFFWRSVKSGAKYSCRFNGRCSISTSGRNACRACRFQRCLSSGMKPDAVRVEKPAVAAKKLLGKRKEDSPQPLAAISPRRMEENDEDGENIQAPELKRARMDNRLLTQSLLLIDRSASDGVREHDEGKHQRVEGIREALVRPQILDTIRDRMSYSPKTAATTPQMEMCERRLLVWAMDWTRLLANLDDSFTADDQIALLRASFAPLTVLELASKTVKNTANPAILCLPCDAYLSRDRELNSIFFLNNKVIRAILSSMTRTLAELDLDEKELVLLKAIVALNPEATGLSTRSVAAVNALRDRAHSALYQQCGDRCGAREAPMRFAKILLLMPHLIMMAGDLVEHVRMRHTFATTANEFDPLLYQLFGDIFDDDLPAAGVERPVDSFAHSSTCSPVERREEQS